MQVINKDVAMKRGYFWVVYEIKLLEVSAVLWGANELTPTIHQAEEKDFKPSEDTENKEPEESTQKKSVSELIAESKININLN
jgi:DNA-directed RNA polymerase